MMKSRDILLAAGSAVIGGAIGWLLKPPIVIAAPTDVPDDMKSIANNVEVKIINMDKSITYNRRMDITQWYCRVLNYSVNNNYNDGWRIRSLTLGLEDKDLYSEADNFVDLIMFLDYFDKGTSSYVELSFFGDGRWDKTATYLPRNEIVYQYPNDGFFKAYTPFTL